MALRLLNGPQALQAVVQPGRMQAHELVSDEVGQRIVCFVARRPAGTTLEEIDAVPPLLSLLCDELNTTRLDAGATEITAAQVDEQSADILQNFYDRSFDDLPSPVRTFVEDRLVTKNGHRNAIPRDDAIAELSAAGVDDPPSALDRLIQGRLLSAEERGGLQRLEITHDVLAPLVVRSRDERLVREASEQFKRESAEQRTRLRRARFAAAVYGVLTLVSLLSAIWAWHAQGIANDQKKDADKQKQAANDAAEAAEKSATRAGNEAIRAKKAEEAAELLAGKEAEARAARAEKAATQLEESRGKAAKLRLFVTTSTCLVDRREGSRFGAFDSLQ